jgi:hypothetical protein
MKNKLEPTSDPDYEKEPTSLYHMLDSTRTPFDGPLIISSHAPVPPKPSASKKARRRPSK